MGVRGKATAPRLSGLRREGALSREEHRREPGCQAPRSGSVPAASAVAAERGAWPLGHVPGAGPGRGREEGRCRRAREAGAAVRGAGGEPRAAAIMLRKLTGEQISDWFTIGKAVTAVEFLGDEAQAGATGGLPLRPPGPLAAREPLAAAE